MCGFKPEQNFCDHIKDRAFTQLSPKVVVVGGPEPGTLRHRGTHLCFGLPDKGLVSTGAGLQPHGPGPGCAHNDPGRARRAQQPSGIITAIWAVGCAVTRPGGETHMGAVRKEAGKTAGPSALLHESQKMLEHGKAAGLGSCLLQTRVCLKST